MPELVNREDWRAARVALLAEEKAFNKARDALAAKRRELPMVRIEKDYRFNGPDGEVGLADLFGGKSQLIVQHFMFGPDWEEGCKSCSFWLDSYDGIDVHLAARDTALVAVAAAPYPTLEAYWRRMGWRTPVVSSHGSDFNSDFHVTLEPGGEYNFRKTPAEGGPTGEMPGASVFARLDDGGVAHSYSTYSRGLDMLNGAYHLLDITPKGRDEDGLSYTMEWLRRRDQYGT